ncbi:hypothetical protein A0H81_10466 [Grifola frondosa]|uniref:Uncharacterized protein n=1 Tax=Grifola frondosa TaxID=5627 RepID=A0A1C7LYZ6_GRIFR|nr:hypothetical protein A0H81_10466 [Grifola frondosa]
MDNQLRLQRCGNIVDSELLYARRELSPITKILNWVAQCFVRKEEGESFACALSVTSDVATIHVAKNTGAPTPDDLEHGDLFIGQMRSFIERKSVHKSVNPKAEVVGFVRATVETSWLRMRRKIELIGTSFKCGDKRQSSDASFSQIDHLITTWTYSSHTETSTTITDHAKRISAGNTIRIMFHYMMCGCLTNADDYFRDKRFESLCEHFLHVVKTAQMLLDSDFLKAVLFDEKWRTNNSKNDIRFLLRLRRRLERVTVYSTGAKCFVDNSSRFFNKLRGSGKQVSIHLSWVNATLSQSQMHVHPEIALVHHLDALGVYAFERAIGGSKLACLACVVYLDQVAEAVGLAHPSYRLNGTIEKERHDWPLPTALPLSVLLSEAVVQRAIKHTKCILQHMH